jgi:hypothetical protein
MIEWDIAIKLGSFAMAVVGVALGAIKFLLDRNQKAVVVQIEAMKDYMTAHNHDDKTEHKAVDALLAIHDTRITRVEQDIKNHPGHTDIGRVFRRIEDVRGEMKEISGSMKALNRAVDLINEHLINREKGS